MRCWLYKIHGLAYHNKKDVCTTFLLIFRNVGNFKRCSEGDDGRRLRNRVYTRGIGVLFPNLYGESASCAIIYMPNRRRHLLFLIFDI